MIGNRSGVTICALIMRFVDHVSRMKEFEKLALEGSIDCRLQRWQLHIKYADGGGGGGGSWLQLLFAMQCR